MPAPQLAGPWPALPLDGWRGTRDALHLWTQDLGKTLLAACPPQNHWWHAALRVSARGLRSPAPLLGADGPVDIELDLVEHFVSVRSAARSLSLPLEARSVHAFHDAYLALVRAAGLDVDLFTTPAEIPDPVPFERDDAPRPYDAAAAHRFWEVLWRCDFVLRELAAAFVGKQSPAHFFWGSFDLAATRFSGRRAPERPGADPVTREAYSHEVISFGFWPGGVLPDGLPVDEPVLYAYAAPTPAGLSSAAVRARAARWDERLGEFLLPYEAVRTAPDPGGVIRGFFEDVYEAAATLGSWDRAALERATRPPAAAHLAGAGDPGLHPTSP
jgi:hypothetical protein